MNPMIGGVIVSVLMLLLGAGVQYGMFSFFMGKMKGAQEALNGQLTAVIGQLASFQGSMQALQTHRAELDIRMGQVERNAEGIVALKGAVDRHMGVYEVHHSESVRRLEKLERGAEGINRQLGSLMQKKARTPVRDLLEMPGDG